MISGMNSEHQAKGDWFFSLLQPEQIIDKKGNAVPFHQADPAYLVNTPSCWTLKPGDAWHGFEDLEEDYCLLDPIKVNITTPGVKQQFKPGGKGHPCLYSGAISFRLP